MTYRNITTAGIGAVLSLLAFVSGCGDTTDPGAINTGGTSPTTGGNGGGSTAGGSGGMAGSGKGGTAGLSTGGSTTTGGGGASGCANTAGSGAGGSAAGAAGAAGGGAGGSAGTAGSGTGGSGGAIDPDTIPKPESKLIGWAASSECDIDAMAANAFVNREVVKVSGYELQAAAQGDEPKTLIFSGESPGFELTGSNKIIIGTGNAVIKGGLSISGGKKNTIIRNMKFSGGEDAIEVSGASCIWFDHIDAFDASDGNMDIVRGSDLITVSWSRFYYVEKSHDHRLSNLNGNNASDTPGKINVTFHHNWWGPKVLQRMPRVRHGKVHVLNNYYSTDVGLYFVGVSDSANLLVEGNYADHPPTGGEVFSFFEDPRSVNIKSSNNVWTGAPTPPDQNADDVFKPPYPYTAESPEYAKAAVMKWAGPDDKKFGN